jgi:NTP pyrophosphatase (non-canonical NTP hydrolase)
MTPNEYQIACLRTAPKLDNFSEDALINCALGITGEAGEVADMIKKHAFQGHGLDEEHFVKELGDVLWYIAVGASAAGYSLNEVMELNIEKLQKRYPNGFDSDRSINRVAGDI